MNAEGLVSREGMRVLFASTLNAQRSAADSQLTEEETQRLHEANRRFEDALNLAREDFNNVAALAVRREGMKVLFASTLNAQKSAADSQLTEEERQRLHEANRRFEDALRLAREDFNNVTALAVRRELRDS